MKINQIINETTTSGSVSTVAQPMMTQTRGQGVYGNTKAGSLLKGKKTNKPYANSLNEGAVKQLSMDLKGGPDGLNDEEFKKKYGKTKAEVRKEMKAKPEPQKEPVKEAKLDEEDIIIVPGQSKRLKSGFVPHGKSRVDHEVEMSRSDVLATIKNAKAIYQLLKDRREDEGIEGWVQEKLIKANDYLNSVKEYYDEKMMQEMTGGVIAGGIAAEGAKVDRMVKHITKSEKKLGHTKKEAENIAWATANKRGMLDNKNKKAK
jgi:hypothetical protein